MVVGTDGEAHAPIDHALAAGASDFHCLGPYVVATDGSSLVDSRFRRAGRTIVLHPNHDLLAAARVLAQTTAFWETYRQQRPMIERTIAWLVRKNSRKLCYRGVDRNRLWLAHRAAAVNLMPLVNLGLAHDGRSWVMAPE